MYRVLERRPRHYLQPHLHLETVKLQEGLPRDKTEQAAPSPPVRSAPVPDRHQHPKQTVQADQLQELPQEEGSPAHECGHHFQCVLGHFAPSPAADQVRGLQDKGTELER